MPVHIDQQRDDKETAMSARIFASFPTDLGTALARAALGIVRRTGAVLKALRHRREVLRLADLDDRTLKDIGLLRSDVEGALLAPLHEDPSKVLCVRRVEHRDRPRPAAVTGPRLAPEALLLTEGPPLSAGAAGRAPRAGARS
jgi:uncharacterized protein YjiS (DUF1127 family)